MKRKRRIQLASFVAKVKLALYKKEEKRRVLPNNLFSFLHIDYYGGDMVNGACKSNITKSALQP